MTNLALTPQWHNDINQIERQELMTGGSDGNMNQATKQLAENILWLKKQTLEPTQQLEKNGYTKLAGGLILQWGAVENNDPNWEGYVDVVFPIPFPNACLNVTASRVMHYSTGTFTAATPAESMFTANDIVTTDATAADGTVLVSRFDKTKVTLNLQRIFTSHIEFRRMLRGATWFAIGY